MFACTCTSTQVYKPAVNFRDLCRPSARWRSVSEHQRLERRSWAGRRLEHESRVLRALTSLPSAALSTTTQPQLRYQTYTAQLDGPHKKKNMELAWTHGENCQTSTTMNNITNQLRIVKYQWANDRNHLTYMHRAGHLSRCVASHPGQLSLAIPSWVGPMSTRQRVVTPCGWGVKPGMVRVSVAGKTVWSACYTRAIHTPCPPSPFVTAFAPRCFCSQ